jgi:hypothetical protein
MAEANEEPDDLVLQDPVSRVSSAEAAGQDFRIPTVSLAAEVVCDDGREFRGRIFIPASASAHTGVMRAEEWMNEPVRFFPLLPDGAGSPIILNKREVLVITVPASADRDLALEEADPRQRRLAVECGGLRLEGSIVIDMPEGHQRVLDYLNGPASFLNLREDDRHHLISKARITRVLDLREE